MSRHLGPKCRLCRQEGRKLFLRGERCNSPKCPLEKKGAVPPGQHGLKRREKTSEYQEQLREKQKAKRIYGISEKQMKNYFKKARKEKAATGKALLGLLEQRLDNVIFRLGFVSSRVNARQIISHGFVLVDGKKVDIPSFQTKPGNVITLAPRALEIPKIKQALQDKDFKIPSWLERKGGAAKVLHLPSEKELPEEVNSQLIVEFYSR